jgi:hypothetical protein
MTVTNADADGPGRRELSDGICRKNLILPWGTMLQDGRSWVRFQRMSLDFSIDLVLPAAVWSWGSTQSLTEMSTRNLPGGK